MKKIVITTLFTALISTSAHSAIFKCVIDGQTVFSDQACSESVEVINIEMARQDPKSVGKSVAMIEKSKRVKKVSDLEGNIKKTKRKISNYRKSMDKELKKLKRKKRYANNNYAGAAWEESISSEMSAVVDKYKTKISIAQDRLEYYQGQLNDLTNKYEEEGLSYKAIGGLI